MKTKHKLAFKWHVRVECEDGMFTSARFTFNRLVGRVQVEMNQAVKEFVNGRRVDDVYPVEDSQ